MAERSSEGVLVPQYLPIRGPTGHAGQREVTEMEMPNPIGRTFSLPTIASHSMGHHFGYLGIKEQPEICFKNNG